MRRRIRGAGYSYSATFGRRECCMMVRRGCYRLLAGIIFATLLSGCGGEKLPGLGQVTGTVTMDGKPVSDAAIVFTPKEPGATASVGQTDASGKYELYYSRGHKGAKVGEHSVTINSFR